MKQFNHQNEKTNKIDYHQKYLKYRKKYLKLKSKMEIINAVNSLKKSPNQSFTFANINYDLDQKEAINSMTIDVSKNNTFNYFGVFNNSKIHQMISSFVQTLNNDTKKSNLIADLLVEKIIKPLLEATNSDSLWFIIRIMYPQSEYYVPRWHSDGLYYDINKKINNKIQIKLAGVLRGPGTLFKNSNDEMRNKFWVLYKKLYQNFGGRNFDRQKDEENRKIIATELKNYPEVQPNNNQVAIFVVGDQNMAAIHSEPLIDNKRFFFSIVPGNRSQIEELAINWNEEFNQ